MKQTSNKSMDIGKALLYLAALMQATQYASAAQLANGMAGSLDFGTWRLPISQLGGFFAGLVVNFSLAYSATRLPRIKSPKAQTWAKAAFYMLLSISPLLIGPANYATMDKAMLGGNWKLQALWAIGWASMMDIAIALVGFVDKDLISLGATLNQAGSDAPAKASDAGSDAQRRSATLKGRSTKKSATLNDAPAKIYQCECGEKFVDRFKFSGHTRTCAVRKDILASKDLTPVQIPTPSKKVTK